MAAFRRIYSLPYKKCGVREIALQLTDSFIYVSDKLCICFSYGFFIDELNTVPELHPYPCLHPIVIQVTAHGRRRLMRDDCLVFGSGLVAFSLETLLS